jgi:membrane protein
MGNSILPRFISYFQQFWVLLKETYAAWSEDNASQLGAALAFYTIFSLAPILIIMVAVVGVFLGKESVQIYLLRELTEVIGKNNANYIMSTLQTSYHEGSGIRATLIAIAIMLVGSTTVCVMLKNALNTMWGVDGRPSGLFNMIKDRIMSSLIIFFAGAFLFFSMIISSFISTVSNFIDIPFIFYSTIDNIVSIILLTLLFSMLYKILPDVKISWEDVWVGGAITAILFTLGKFLLGLYLARSTVSSAYGAAGSLVILLLWVYYSAQIIFLGAEFTQVYARKYGSEIVPKKPQAMTKT